MAQSLTQITPQLWVQQSELYMMNSGLFVSQGRACLIDPGVLPDETKAIVAFLAEHNLEPELLILTHSHWDHILGPAYFPGVKRVAQANYVKIVDQAGQTIRKIIAKWEKEARIRRDTPFTLPYPDMIFQDRLTLHVGNLRLELLHVPGHAADQLAVYQPESGAFWASDILSDVEIPFISDNLAAYEQTLDKLSGLDIRALVPGHGHPTTDLNDIQNRFSEDKSYLARLRERVSQAVWDGKSVEETVGLCEDMIYRHPDDNQVSHRLNVESVYLELGGEADPTKVGWQIEG
jgi:glyoxylase-like metal-dependent hydrolase (beta-lactamase superfamily II)